MSEFVDPLENICNLIPKKEFHSEKPPMYISKYRPTVVLEEKSSKDAMRTMGPAKVEAVSQSKYLKKHSKEPILPEKTEFHHNCCTVRKPPVPLRTDIPPMDTRTKISFIKPDPLTTVYPQPIWVDSIKGDKQILENSGLVPKYVKKKDYGEVPQYLEKRNEEEQRAQEEYENLMKEQKEQKAMKYLSEEKRQAVLEGLKKNWDRIHHEYQGLSFIIDNLSKKAHKEHLEAAMNQLEKDINLLEMFKTIYLPNT